MAQTLRLSRLVRSGVALGVVFPLVVSLSAVAQTPPPDSVPSVELTRFEARTEGNEAILTWTTASETNNAGFSIERKRDDGSFERLAFKEGTGPTEGPQSYRFRTTALDPGVHTFRLRQENLDGSTTLSDTVSVEVRLSDAYEISSVRPNPVRSSATVSVTVRETQEVRAAVYNVLGQRVATLYDGLLSANDPTTLEVGNDLQSGVYFLRVEGESFSETRKFVRVR